MKRPCIVLFSGCLLAAAAAGEQQELIRRDGKWVRAAKPAKGTPAGEAAIVRRNLAKKHYRAAVRHAKRFLNRYGDDPLREEVFSLAGEAELRRGRYWPAYEWYRKQLKEFPSGVLLERALERQMEIAEAFLAGRKRLVLGFIRVSGEQDGIDILRRIAEFAAGTPRAEMALLAIGDHYFQKRKWADAAEVYEGFGRLHPKSVRSAHAEARLAESLLRSYRGPLWDGSALVEAEQRYKAFASRHPAAAARAGVDRILREIHQARGRKAYEIGRFYGRTGKSAAAVHYFRLVLKDYGDTQWAGRAWQGLCKAEHRGGAQPHKPKPSQSEKEAK